MKRGGLLRRARVIVAAVDFLADPQVGHRMIDDVFRSVTPTAVWIAVTIWHVNPVY